MIERSWYVSKEFDEAFETYQLLSGLKLKFEIKRLTFEMWKFKICWFEV